jgi:hypothetical protein
MPPGRMRADAYACENQILGQAYSFSALVDQIEARLSKGISLTSKDDPHRQFSRSL